MKSHSTLVILVSLVVMPTVTFAKPPFPAQGDPEAFCSHDPRPEIRAYCKNLAALQTAVNTAKASSTPNLARANPDFANSLGKLDLTSPKATDDFITATAGTLAVKSAVADALRGGDQGRPDQQLGTASKTSGTTSLVSTAGSAELLSLALNTGAVTESVDGTTATLNTNADQIFRLVTVNDPDCIINCRGGLGWVENRILSPINLSATLDLAQQNTKNTPTSGQASGTTQQPVSTAAIPTGAGKLSSLTARYQLMNSFDPRSTKFQTAWRKEVVSLAGNVRSIGDDTDAVYNILLSHEPYSDPAKDTTTVQPAQDSLVSAAASDPTGTQLVKAFEEFWLKVTSKALQDSKLAPAISKAVQDKTVYRQAWLNALDDAVGNLLTFEYTYNRPQNQPKTHDVKLIYAYNFQSAGMLTFNGAVSFYGAIPVGAKYGRIHDGQVSGEYDRTLTGKDKALQTQLTLAGYWQYQPNPSVLSIPAGTVAPGTTIPLPNGTQEFVGTAGSLWVTQAKITIKGAGGINVPIAVSWSNKKDLLQGNKVGAQFGISYNFSSLAGLFTGGSQ